MAYNSIEIRGIKYLISEDGEQTLVLRRLDGTHVEVPLGQQGELVNAAIIVSGDLADRPVTPEDWFYAEDEGVLYKEVGGEWQQITDPPGSSFVDLMVFGGS